METQILKSTFKNLGPIVLPPTQMRQKRYMPFDLNNIQMEPGFEDYQEVVSRLCRPVWRKGTAYLTVDEKLIEAGMSQRRPRPHVDGCFLGEIPGIRMPAWGGGGGGGGWLHYCNDVGGSKIGRMAVIVAASVKGCRAWRGIFNGRPAKDGDLSHIANQLGEGEILQENVGYLLSPDCVHESMRFEQATLRTFIRIALPTTFSEASEWD